MKRPSTPLRKFSRGGSVAFWAILALVGSAHAFINGVDTSLVPPSPNQSILVEVPAGSGGEVSAAVWPYNGGLPAAGVDHMGKSGDGGLANNIDDCAGAKITLLYDPTGGGTGGGQQSWGNSTCAISGADRTGASGVFTETSQTVTTNDATPGGELQSIIHTTMVSPATYSAQVEQKTLIRGNQKGFYTIYYVTNISSRNFGEEETGNNISIPGVRLFQGVDWNFNGTFATTDQVVIDLGTNTLYGFDQNAPPGSIAYGGFSTCEVAPDDYGGNRYDLTWISMRTNTLSQFPNFTGDASGALRWNLGLITPGQTVAFPIIWGVGATLAEMQANLNLACGSRYDVSIKSIDGPTDGDNLILGSTVQIDATAQMEGVVDQFSVPVIISITGPGGYSLNDTVGNVSILANPSPKEAAVPSYFWDTTGLLEGTYTITVCTSLGNDQDVGDDCKSVMVTLVDLVIRLEPDQSLQVSPGTDADYPIVIENVGPVQCVDFAVSASSLGWPSQLLDGAATTLIAEDTDGNGTWDFIAPGYDLGCVAPDGRPDLVVPAGAPGSPSTVMLTFRKNVPALAPLGVTDTTVLTVVPEISNQDTATFLTSTPPPPIQAKTLHLHPGLGMDTSPDTSANNTSTAIPAFSSIWFQQSTAFQSPFTIVGGMTDVEIPLYIGTASNNRSVTVSLFATNGMGNINIGSSTLTVNQPNNPATPAMFALTVSNPIDIPAGYRLTLQITNNTANSISIWHDSVPASTDFGAPGSCPALMANIDGNPNTCPGSSQIAMQTTTYINVSVQNAYDAAFDNMTAGGGGTAPGAFDPTGTVAGAWLRGFVQDPFGEADIGGGLLNLPKVFITVESPTSDYIVDNGNPPVEIFSDTYLDPNADPSTATYYLMAEVDGSPDAGANIDGSGDWYELPIPLQAKNPGTYTVCIQAYESNGVLTGCTFQFVINSASAVSLTAFDALGYEDAVHVRWTTAQEIGTLGFNLYRSTLPDRGFVRINGELIAGLGYSDLGGNYLFADQTVEAGRTYFYLLEEVEEEGDRNTFGPVYAVAHPGTTAPSVSSQYLTNAVFLDELPLEWIEGGADGGVPPPVGGGSRVLVTRASGENGALVLTIDVDVPPPDWAEVDVGETTYDVVSMSGYGRLGVSGAPDLPAGSFLVDVPSGMDFSWLLAGVSASGVSDARIVPTAPPVLPSSALNDAQDIESGDASPVEDPAVYGSEAAYPGYWADVQAGPRLPESDSLLVSVYPVQASPATQSAQVAASMQLTVNLTPNEEAAGTPNPSYAMQWQLAGGAAAKVLVTERGVQQLTGAELAAAGLDLGAPAATLQVFYKGEEVPVAVYDGGDGVLDPTDVIEFYGEPAATEFTHTAVYWVRAGAADGERPGTLDADPSSASPVAADATHLSRARTGEETRYFISLNAPGEPHWFHDQVFASPGTQSGKDVTVSLTDLVKNPGDEAVLGYELRGNTTDDAVSPDHHVRVEVNGNAADEAWFDGRERLVRRVPIPVDWLVEGANTVRIVAAADSGVYDSFYIRYAELLYPRGFTASNDALRFAPPAAGAYTVTGFNGSDIRLYDVADPRALTVLENTSVDAGDDAYEVSLGLPSESAPRRRSLLAVTNLSVKKPEVLANTPGALSSAANGADYVIVTTADLAPSLAPLIALRESQGMRVKTVDIEEVYDEFSYGELDPSAVRELLRRAVDAWEAPAPRYLLLVGDASYDSVGRLNPLPAPGGGTIAPAPTAVPTTLYDNPYSQTASDNALALLDGDLLPDVAVGRIPARDAAELDRIVAKIVAYEQLSMDEPFTKDVLLVADNAVGMVKRSFDFVFSNFIAGELADLVEEFGLAPTFVLLPDYKGGTYDVASVTDAIVQGLTDGALLTTYSGHGSTLLWADEVVFRTASPFQPIGPANRDDVAGIANSDAPTVVLALNCLNAFFIDPYAANLAEVLLRDSDSGTVAFIGPTGMSLPNIQHTTAAAFYRAVLQDGTARLGDAVRAAFVASAASPGFADMMHTWVLLGDPAMRLRVNHAPVVSAQGPALSPLGRSVRLDGAQSSDPNEDPISFEWEIVSKPEGSLASVSDAAAATAALMPDVPGEYTLRLTVTDSFGASAQQEVSVFAGDAQAAGGCELGVASSPALVLALLLPFALLALRRPARLVRGRKHP